MFIKINFKMDMAAHTGANLSWEMLVTNHNNVVDELEAREQDAETDSSCSAGERHFERTVMI